MQVEIRFFTKKTLRKPYISNRLQKVAKGIGGKNAKISLVFVGEKRIRDINRIYRGKDKVTDVISFSEISGKKDKFVAPKEEGDSLGEIFICLTQAEKQAKKKEHSIKKEIDILLIHGLLHLAGYDHENEYDAVKMETKENVLMKLLYN